MPRTYFTADWHLGDARVMTLDRRPFASLEEQDEELIDRYNAKVADNDRVYFLGDLSLYGEKKTAELMKRLRGHKHFIRGNHDRFSDGALKGMFRSVADYEEILVDGQHVVLSHYPLAHWRGQRYGYVHCYGHTHLGEDAALFEMYRKCCVEKGIRFYAYNAGCMLYQYEPVTIEEMRKLREEQQNESGVAKQ